jgi:hypothetical protein
VEAAMTKIKTWRIDDVKNTVGTFAWDFGRLFFVQTGNLGNFVWSDPDYGGTNNIHPFDGTYADFVAWADVPYCRDKGRHVIVGYAGDSLKIGVPITKQMIKDKTFPAGVKP